MSAVRLRSLAIKCPEQRAAIADIFLERFPSLERRLLLLDDRELLREGSTEPSRERRLVVHDHLHRFYFDFCVNAALGRWDRDIQYLVYAETGAGAAILEFVNHPPQPGWRESMQILLMLRARSRALDAWRADHPDAERLVSLEALDDHGDTGTALTPLHASGNMDRDLREAICRATRQALEDLEASSIRYKSGYHTIILALLAEHHWFNQSRPLLNREIAERLGVAPATVTHALTRFRGFFVQRLIENDVDPRFLSDGGRAQNEEL